MSLKSSIIIKCSMKNMLNQELKALLGSSIIFSGLLNTAANVWLISSLYLRAEVITFMHLRLLNLSVACFGRSLLAGYPFQATSAILGSWLFGDACCRLFAFLRIFFNVAEILSLMFLVTECKNLIRSCNTGNIKNYIGTTILCWIFALFFASLPLIEFGRYSCDMAAISCNLEWSSKKKNDVLYNYSYILLAQVLPTCIMFWSLFQIITSPALYLHYLGHEKFHTVKAVIGVTISMLITWIPNSLSSLFQLCNINLSHTLIFIELICIEVSGIFPTLSFFCFDYQTRCTLLGRQYQENKLEEHNKTKQIVKKRRYERHEN